MSLHSGSLWCHCLVVPVVVDDEEDEEAGEQEVAVVRLCDVHQSLGVSEQPVDAEPEVAAGHEEDAAAPHRHQEHHHFECSEPARRDQAHLSEHQVKGEDGVGQGPLEDNGADPVDVLADDDVEAEVQAGSRDERDGDDHEGGGRHPALQQRRLVSVHVYELPVEQQRCQHQADELAPDRKHCGVHVRGLDQEPRRVLHVEDAAGGVECREDQQPK